MTDKEEQKVIVSLSVKQFRIIKISIIVILFLLPILYLYYKTAEIPDEPKEATKDIQSSPSTITSLENAVNTNPSFDNLINLSIAYINNQMPSKSLSHLNRAIELNPNSVVAYNNLGVAYTMLKQYKKGIDACTKALQIDSTFQLAKNNLKWAKDEKNKILLLIQAQEKTASNVRNVNFYIEQGFNYYKIGDYDKSIAIWTKVFDTEPKNTAALNNIGSAFMMKDQFNDAISLFKRVLELEPDNQLAKNNLAWGLNEKRKTEALIKK